MRRLSVLAAVLIGVAGVPAAEALDADVPVLWEGVIHDAAGDPAEGTRVVAYARPPATEMATGDALVPVAQTTTDSAGRYRLRSGNTDALRAATDDAGWVTVMVSAVGPAGVSLAVDTISWLPFRGPQAQRAGSDTDVQGRWVTTHAQAMAAAEAGARDYRAVASGPEPQPAVALERPAVLHLARPAAAAAAKGFGTQAATHPPMREAGMCVGPHKKENLGKRYVAVGELHLDRNWNGRFQYTQAKSTSFQVGFRPTGGKWSAGGSVSSLKGSATSQENPSLPENHMFTYRAEMVFYRYTWKCNRAEQWNWVETVEPVLWTGGMRRTDHGTPPRCHPNYRVDVLPGGKFTRETRSSTTMNRAISVLGFSGSATSTVAPGVEYTWLNRLPKHRNVCGDRAFPSENTRIRSLP